MNFRQRLARYGLGIGIGILLSVYFFSGRGCGDWLPANRIRADIRTAGLAPDARVTCLLECAGGGGGLDGWLTRAELDLGASGPREVPRRYVFRAEETIVALEFVLTDTAAVVHAVEPVPANCGC